MINTKTAEALLNGAREHVRHEKDCPSVTHGAGDAGCTCGAVAYLDQFDAAIQPSDMPFDVSVDGTLYEVRPVKLDTEDGEFCATSLVINVQAGAPTETQRVILLHELVHACFEHAGSPPGPFTEEHVACLISRRLLPILRDNPALVAYLTDDGRQS